MPGENCTVFETQLNSLQCLLFQQTITMQISKQPVDLKVSDQYTYPPFLKYVFSLIQKILLWSKHSGIAFVHPCVSFTP